jgi:hypothetical protein
VTKGSNREAGTVTPQGIACGTGLAVGIGLTGDVERLGRDRCPSYRWGLAPLGVMTRRQLAAAGLRPGGAQPVARIVWRRGRRWAELYSIEAALPKRPMTEGRRRALGAAMAARRRCPRCCRDAGYVIPGSLGCCVDCSFGAARAIGSDIGAAA